MEITALSIGSNVQLVIKDGRLIFRYSNMTQAQALYEYS